jgi:hypothetical protein
VVIVHTERVGMIEVSNDTGDQWWKSIERAWDTDRWIWVRCAVAAPVEGKMSFCTDRLIHFD